MVINESNRQCSACTACVNICPKNAIELKENEKGFMYPIINIDRCVGCGMCVKVCQCYNITKKIDIKFIAYTRHNSVKCRMQSQSGGLFSGIAEVVFSMNGVCYGAAVCDDLVVRCIRINSVRELYKLQGSKYVQCDYNGSFKNVENDLDNGRVVLFSGTSCAIDGLTRYLKSKQTDTSKLYTCDLICHGIPSPKMIVENIDRIEKEYHKDVKKLRYRDKEQYGWHSHIETYTFTDGSAVSDKIYTDLFYSHLAFRECCFDCQYANIIEKNADITMADFWGISKTKEEDDNSGWSVAVVRSEKMLELLKIADLEVHECSIELALANNRTGNVRMPKKYDAFWSDYQKKGFIYVLKKYTIYGGIPFRLKRKVLMKLNQW